MSRCVKAVQLPEDDYGFLLRAPALSSLAARMRNAFHIALAISPLLALRPWKFPLDIPPRNHLLAVSFFSIINCNGSILGVACYCTWEPEVRRPGVL